MVVLGIASASEGQLSFIASDEDSYAVKVSFAEMPQYLLKLKKFVCGGKLFIHVMGSESA